MGFKDIIKQLFSSEKETTEEEQHPIFEDYNKLLMLSRQVSQEEWDKLFMEYYQEHEQQFSQPELLENEQNIVKLVGIYAVYSRILDNDESYDEGSIIANKIDTLIAKLDKHNPDYIYTYVIGQKWHALSLKRNKKYRESNTIYQTLKEFDPEHSKYYEEQIIDNYYYMLTKYCFMPIICVCGGLMIFYLVADAAGVSLLTIGKILFIIIAIILFASVLAFFNLRRIITYYINKKDI